MMETTMKTFTVKATIRIIAKILLLGWTVSLLLPAAPTTISVPRKWLVVIGFEFTMHGIVTSAGLPNGTAVAVGFTHGSEAYRAEMFRLYSICNETSRTGVLPSIAKELFSAGAPFSWRSMELHRWIGGPVTELRDAVVETKRAALRTLSKKHGVTGLEMSETFHALATAPSFIFTALKQVSTRCPHDGLELASLEFENDLDVDARFQARAWQSLMAAQFSQAVVEAGFHRCTIPYTKSSNLASTYPQAYDDMEFVHPSASHVVCSAELGVCRLKSIGVEEAMYRGSKPCSRVGTVAVVANLEDSGLSLWAEGINECYIKSTTWQSWPELKPPRPQDMVA